MEASIFVQIASYRDDQLIPTLVDLVEHAAAPKALHITVCWQHAANESIADFLTHGFSLGLIDGNNDYHLYTLEKGGAGIRLIDVPHQKSQGACWARNMIQQHYQGETYTLQLDSHHRFVEHWDAILIEMLESLRGKSPKPVLTAYLPGFNPRNDPASKVAAAHRLTFDKFSDDGMVLLKGRYIDESISPCPVPGSFYSAHFAFADGSFATEVQHDPRIFFIGEEISIAARAYTHGYDLYNPHRPVAWHEYSREGRVKIWDDHTSEAKNKGEIDLHWGERNDRAMFIARHLLGVDGEKPDGIDFGPYGLGSVRSLAQYERYAGLNFAHRAAHRNTLEGHPPPIDEALENNDASWSAFRRSNDIRVADYMRESSSKWLTATMGVLRFFDSDGVELHSETLDAAKLKSCVRESYADYLCTFLSDPRRIPARYTLELYDDAAQCLERYDRQIAIRTPAWIYDSPVREGVR